MMTEEQKKELNSKYEMWRDAVSGTAWWVYLIVVLVLGVIAWAAMTRMKQSPKKS